MSPGASSIWVSPQRERLDLLVQGTSVVKRADDLYFFLSRRAGAEAANLFAKPQMGSQGELQWVDRQGATRTVALNELPDGERKAVEEKLRATLAAIEPLQNDPELGVLLSAALMTEHPDAIRAANGRPILAGWGAIPESVTTTDQMRRHYERTLGPFLTLTDPPVPGRVNRDVPAITAPRLPARPFERAPSAALLTAAAVLALLLLPGVLLAIYPTAVAPAVAMRNDEEVNRALENQVRDRERQLGGNVCTLENGAMPRIEPRSSTDPRSPESPGGATAPSGRGAELTPPVRPDQTRVPDQAVPPRQSERPSNLAQFVQDATVMVWTGNGFGSGFFITPELVLTNRHVVEKSSGTIRVGNHKLGQMMPVQPVAMSSNSNLGEPDYALLKLQSGQSSTFLSMTEELPGQLQNVIAAGYPNNVVSTDANYERLQRGDAAAIPDVALTEGAVVVVQNSETRSPIILHRASISPGSSGGPLIDECGRAIGINTFVRSAKEEEGSDRMHYSLGATSAIQFVKQNGATPNVVSGRCIVSTASNSQKPGADDGGAREQPRQPPPAGAADPKP